jgi:hypothetical protein
MIPSINYRTKSLIKRLLLVPKFGDKVFSRRKVDKSSWSEEDHYAYCLYLRRNENTTHRNGLFYNTAMTESAIEERLWLGILRETQQRGGNRRQERKRQEDEAVARLNAKSKTSFNEGSSPCDFSTNSAPPI